MRNFNEDVQNIINLLSEALRAAQPLEQQRLADEAYSYLYDLIRDINRGQVTYEEDLGV